MTQKLYRCEVTFVYYALADSPREAADFARDAAADTVLDESVDAEAYSGLIPTCDLEVGWDTGSCVYHNGSQDITLGEVLARQ